MLNFPRFFYGSIALLFTSLFLFACSQDKQSPMQTRAEENVSSAPAPPPQASQDEYGAKAKDAISTESSPTAPADAFITAVASLGKFGEMKKFIRTAELKFRVSDALHATLTVENVAARNGGFVTENNLVTEVEYRNTIPVSSDSLLEQTRFVVRNQLVLRVPADKLDTTLREIGRLAEFLDYRRVKATDVGLQLLEQDLEQARLRSHQEQIGTAIQKSNKAESITAAADKMLNSRAASDAARIEGLKIEDAVQYSTVRLDIYQRSAMQQQKVARERPVAAFEPGFGTKLGAALSDGWAVLLVLFVALARLWSIVLLLVLLYLGLKFWRVKRSGKA